MFEFDSQIWADYFVPILVIWFFYILRREYEATRRQYRQSYTPFLLTGPGIVAAISCEISYGLIAIIGIAPLIFQFWNLMPMPAPLRGTELEHLDQIFPIMLTLLAYILAAKAAYGLSELVHALTHFGWVALYHPRTSFDL